MLINLAAILAVAGLATLGTWQVQRRVWKLDLIARVEARIHAPAAAAPGPADWPAVSEAADAYRRVRLTGRFLQDRTILVQAVTEYGGGFWVMTPLRSADGSTVVVNRGFVPADRRDPAGWRRPDEPAAVTGLLRITEPGGAYLRSNAPDSGRWYSRDVAAIAAAQGLSDVAPYFVDAEAEAGAAGLPVAGLTIIAFSNNHLVYAATWFVLATMVAAGATYASIDHVRRRRGL